MEGTTYDGVLLLSVQRPELLAHLQARAEHHERRATELGKEASDYDAKLRAELGDAGTVTDRMAAKVSNSYRQNENLRDDFLKRSQGHAQKAVAFRFYATHLPETGDDDFLLSRAEAVALEFVPPVNAGW